MSRMRRIKSTSEKNFKNWEVLLENFLDVKRAERKAKRTIDDYSYHVKQFFNRYPSGDVEKNLLDYLSQDIATATYNLRLTYLRGFFQYLVDEGIIIDNPLIRFHRKRTEPRIVDIDVETLQKLILLPDVTMYSGLRDKTLICLTLDCGIRPKEAHQLKVNDFDRIRSQIIVRGDVSKTRSQRVLPITQPTVNLITRLVSVRPKYWSDDVPLFASSDGTPLNKNTWHNRIKKYGKMLDVKITPYDLRHCFALNFLRNGGNAIFLQKIMGHTDLNMTKKYIAATDKDLKEALQVSSPLTTLIKPKRNRVGKI